MKNWAVVLGLAILAGCKQAPPSVDVIAERHLEALGGAAALRSMTSWRMSGTIAHSDGTTSHFTADHKRPNLCRWEATGRDGSVGVRAYNGRVAWRTDGAGPVQVLSGAEAKERIDACEFDEDPLLDYQKRGIFVRNVGVEYVEGRKAYKLHTETPRGVIKDVYIDSSSWLDVRLDYVDPDGTTTVQRLLDRRTIGGISTATTWVMTDGDGAYPMRSHADTIEFDVAIPDSRFDPPSGAGHE